MSGEKQPHTPEEAVINRVAEDSGVSPRTLRRMCNRYGRGTYEEGLDREINRRNTLSSIRDEIERRGFIEGEQVG
jgi:AraC-like DNA-binding protein